MELTDSLVAATSSVTTIGSEHTILGAGRPAAEAAALRTGAICVEMVLTPVIQSTVPSVRDPANSSILVPRAATRRLGVATSLGPMGPVATALTRSPFTATASPRSNGTRALRY